MLVYIIKSGRKLISMIFSSWEQKLLISIDIFSQIFEVLFVKIENVITYSGKNFSETTWVEKTMHFLCFYSREAILRDFNFVFELPEITYLHDVNMEELETFTTHMDITWMALKAGQQMMNSTCKKKRRLGMCPENYLQSIETFCGVKWLNRSGGDAQELLGTSLFLHYSKFS